MRILFTGASSFTGYHLVKALAGAGHEVVAAILRPVEEYQGVRRERVEALAPLGARLFGLSFGGEAFMRALEREGPFDLLCHHAAQVGDYRSPDFDVAGALAANTRNLAAVLRGLGEQGCGKLIITGTVFEQNEGAGDEPRHAFSPYGLSKGLTSTVFEFYAHLYGLSLGKFVIPNPFGPLEEPRFTAYLIRTWKQGKTPSVNTPRYVRDNIHVSLLAAAYADFAAKLPEAPGFTRYNPSGYVETQGAFAQRFAEAMAPRLDMACPVELAEQTDFSEPMVRINTQPVDGPALGWDEGAAWDEVAAYYQSH